MKKNIAEIIDSQMSDITKSEVLNTKPKKNLFKKLGPKKVSIIVLVIIAITGVYGTSHFYNKYKSLTVDASAQAQKETNKLVATLGKLMELPSKETPTVATISDKDKLKDQAFFAQAENGDVLFAFTTSMKAILYRPSTNKIINVAPISINQAQDLTQASKKVTATTTKK
jgi:hypothetical protein